MFIDIKSNLLKWCPAGFQVDYNDVQMKYVRTTSGEGGATLQKYGKEIELTHTSTVRVNEKAYEKACINHLKTMTQLKKFMVVKDNCGIYISEDMGLTSINIMPITCDPRPNCSERYKIEVN